MKQETSLVFTGDIGFDRYMDHQWEDPALISDEVLSFLHSGDHVIANVEGPLVDQATNQTTEGTVQLMHTMNPKAVGVLEAMHADIWNLCNNHMLDAGEAGVAATLQEAEKAGARGAFSGTTWRRYRETSTGSKRPAAGASWWCTAGRSSPPSPLPTRGTGT